jgi:hypothetical protein
MVKRQRDLWQEGLSIGEMFAKHKNLEAEETNDQTEEEGEEAREESNSNGELTLGARYGDYGGGKWGRYLRAPDFYFEIMREFGNRFTRIGEVATITYGIKSGCDAFFMPKNVSAQLLIENRTEMEWRLLPLMRRCTREEVETGDVVIVQCGDRTLHPVEAKYVRPEVHNLMRVDRPVVSSEHLDRVVLWVDDDLKDIRGTYVRNYITWGSKQTFSSARADAVPIPEKATASGRKPWYRLTNVETGIGFWPEGQQYRHIIPANPHGLVCNHKLFDIHPTVLTPLARSTLMPILNSTLVAFIKPFYGRYAGTEGNLQVAVTDALLLDIPDPRNATQDLEQKLKTAFDSMQARKNTHLVEEVFMECHTTDEVREAEKLPLTLPAELQHTDRRQLDDAVFELLGVTDARRRQDLIDRLYREVALHLRAIRIVEVQKMEQRRQGNGKNNISQQQLALDAWKHLEPELQKPLSEWIEDETRKAKTVNIPDGDVRLAAAENWFEATTVYFGKMPATSHACASRPEAELIATIARQGLRGAVSVPRTEKECRALLEKLNARVATARRKFEVLADERAGSEKLREQVLELLNRWFVHGLPQ